MIILTLIILVLLLFLFFITFIFNISTLDFFSQFDLYCLHVFFLAIVHAFTFTYNNFYFFGPGGKVEGLGHLVTLWSLSIEEVFYLIWPVLILVFRKRRIILVVLLLLFFYSVLYRVEYGSGALYSYFGCVDMLSIGCFVALMQESSTVQKFLKFSQIGLLSTSLLLFYFLVSFDIHTNHVTAPSLIGLTSGMFILFASAERATLKSKVGFMQMLAPLRLLGFLSYELYLFHLIFWGLFYKFDVTHGTAWLSTLFPITVAIFVCLVMHLYIFEPARRITYEFLKGNSL
jgi:peptidoglycan/LPS O-acetylase OafA/YrhL